MADLKLLLGIIYWVNTVGYHLNQPPSDQGLSRQAAALDKRN